MLHERRQEEQRLLQLRVEYWSKRLDHTLNHTDTSFRRMYLVDGAVLALVYFVMQTFGITPIGELSRRVSGIVAIPTFLLALLNGLHVLLLRSQGLWYSKIDMMLLGLLAQEPAREAARPWYKNTHGIYAALHSLIMLFLFAAASGMFLYSWGYFETFTVRISSPPR
jgi:hypothetical protein